MSKRFEDQYFDLLDKILREGTVCVSGRQTDDSHVTRTKRIWGYTFDIDLGEEYPLLYSKHVAVKSAIREILWIMQKQSNNIKDLIPKIWDKWADKDGSIRKTYGWQIHRPVNHPLGNWPDQVSAVIGTKDDEPGMLGIDPSTRHCVINMWDGETLDDNNCPPCCYTSHYTVMDGKLNIAVIQRSADSIIGLPFNIAQYAFLAKAFARHLGLKPGRYIHVITDAHIYENQYGNFDTNELNPGFAELMQNHKDYLASGKKMHPDVKFDESSNSFWDITDHNFEITGYKAGVDCCEDISFDVTK